MRRKTDVQHRSRGNGGRPVGRSVQRRAMLRATQFVGESRGSNGRTVDRSERPKAALTCAPDFVPGQKRTKPYTQADLMREVEGRENRERNRVPARSIWDPQPWWK